MARTKPVVLTFTAAGFVENGRAGKRRHVVRHPLT
jgi:hypothetical protein